MKKPSFSQRFPLVARMCRFWDNLLDWTEIRAARLRKKIRKILKPDTSWRRRRYLPEMEGLEFRWMPALHVTSFTPTPTGYRVQFDQPVDPAPLNIYDASGAYGPTDATIFTGNQVEKIAFTGTVTGGTFTLAYNGATSGAISYSATASTLQTNVQNALDALTSVGSGNSAVNALSSTQVQVTFQGLLAMQTMATMTATNSLSGVSPSLNVTNVTTPDTFRLAAIANADNTAFTFLRSGTGSAGLFAGVLTTGTYRITLRSASDAFKDLGGGLLDGDNNGSTGDDYVNTITVSSTPSVILSIPDFTRGPDSSHNVRVPSSSGSAIQTISFTGATGGTFTLGFNGSSTAAINYSTVATTLQSNIQSALDVLSSIGLANTSVSASATAPQVTFQMALGGSTQPVMTVSNSLTGTTPTVSVSTTTNGVNIGIPITLSGAVNVTDVTFDLAYDPELLNIASVFTATAGTLTLVSATNGVASFNFHSGTPRSGTVTLGQIVAQVPDSTNSNYGASRLLDLSNIVINSGAISGAEDDGVQVVAYFGDTDGNGYYTSNDSTLISNVATVVDSGFAAYRLIEPRIIGDINANGFVDSGDATQTNRLLAGLKPAQYPPLPPTTHFSIVPSTSYPSSGSAFSVTVTALDQFNHQSLFYGGLVHFTTTDASASVSLPSDYRFVATDIGVHTFTNGVTLYTAGSQTVTATDTSSSGITGTSDPIYPLGVTQGYVRTADPVQSVRVPVGNALVLPGTGGLIISHMLDLDRSPSTPTLGGEPALVYASSTVNVVPIVEAVYTSDPNAAIPSQIEARLNWNGGGFGGWTTFSTSGHSAGDTYVVALQGSSVTATDYYSFTIDVKVTVSGTPTTYSSSGNVAIVVQGSSDSFGQGWSLAGVDHLVTTTNGAILVDGETGSGRYFALGGGVYTSPANDFGHLAHSGNTYTYETEHLLTYSFDSNGNLAKIADAHGLTRTFVYDGNGLLTQVKDPDGSTTTLSYDGSNKLSKIEAPGPRTVTVTVDGSGNLTKIVNPDNGTRTFTYDGSHRITDDRLAPLGTFSYGYSSSNGTLTTVTLDATTSYTLSAGNTQALATSPAKNLAAAAGKLTDPLGHVYTYTLDAQDRLTKLETPNGGTGLLTETWNRTLAGLSIGHTDPLGRLTNYGYDSSGDMTGVFYADHTQQTTAYSATYHLPTSSTDQRGNVTQYLYDSTGSLTAVIDPLNQTTSFLRDSAGNATVMVDALGNRTSYLFDATNMATVIIDALNNRTSYQLDAAGNATVAIDPLNHRVTTAYDGMRRVTSVTRPGLLTDTLAYDFSGRLTDRTDALNRTTHFSYDSQGRLSATTAAYGTGLAATTTNLYDAAGNVTGQQDPLNRLTSYIYDTLNRMTVTVDALTNRTTLLLDGVGNVTAAIDALNNHTSFLYDALNRQTVMIDALGNRTTSFYDAAGNMTGMRDPLNHLTAYLYDSLERQTVTVDALGNRTTLVLDAFGNVTAVVDALNHRTSFQFDALNRQTVSIDALTNRSTLLFDAAGNMTGQLDALNHLTSYFYDEANRLTATVDALGNMTSYLLDATDNVTAVVDPRGNRTSYLFDALNRQTVTIDALNQRTTLLLDLAGNVTGVMDANVHLTKYALDALNRVTMTTDANNQVSYVNYDAVGNATAMVDQLGNRTSFVFDALNRSTVTIDALANRTTSFYDAAGNLTGVLDANLHLTRYAYDALNRVTMITDANNQSSYNFYDAVGNMTGQQDPLGHLTANVFDAANRLSVTVDALGNRTTLTLDAVGNATALKDANSHVTSYLFDSLNRATVTIDALTNRTTTFYDKAGNMTGVMDANGHLTTYALDALNRVTLTTGIGGQKSYSYFDAAGNTTGVKDDNNQLTKYFPDAVNRVTMTTDPQNNTSYVNFDAAGNATVLVDAATRRTSYLFDSLNRATVTIDALTNRTTAFFDRVGNMTGVMDARSHLTQYAPDAVNRVTMVTDANSKNSFTYFDAAGNVTGSRDRNGNLTRSALDALNRVTMMTDAANKNSYRYFDAAGNMTGMRDATGGLTQYFPDADNRVTMTTDPNNHSTRNYFDGASNMTGTRDANGRLTQTPDHAADLSNVTVDATGARTTMLYDGAGNVTEIIAPPAGRALLSFSYDSSFAASDNPSAITAADVDGDGKQDLITADFTNSFLEIFTGDGAGGFTSTTIIYDTSITDPMRIYAVFFPGITTPTLVFSWPSGVSWLPANGVGTYDPTQTTNYSATINDFRQAIAIADFNNDGLPDLALAHANGGSSQIRILAGQTNGTFSTSPTNYSIPNPAYGLMAGDLNNDGFADLVVSIRDSNKIRPLINQGNGTFSAGTDITDNNSPNQIVIADLDHDGNQDIASLNIVGIYSGYVTTYLGKGDGTFAAGNVFYGDLDPGYPFIGITSPADGNVYLVGGPVGSWGVNVLTPYGDGDFMATPQQYYYSTDSNGFCSADFDNDGVPDIAVVNLGTLGVTNGTVDIFMGDTLDNRISNVNTFTYDGNNRLISQTETLGNTTQTTQFSYNAIGLMTSTTDALGRRREFVYDSLNRLSTEKWFNNGSTSPAQLFTSLYDAVGNMTVVQNAAGAYTMSYDALDRVTVVQEPVGVRLTFTYDDAGNRTSVKDSFGGIETSTYDTNNYLVTRMFTGIGSSQERVDLTYKDNYMLNTLKRYSDVNATVTAMTTTYLYDAFSQVTAIRYYDGSGTALASFAYSYDNAGRLTSKTDYGVATSFVYSATNQLKTDDTSSYHYDAAGNRIDQATNLAYENYQVAGGNQTTNDGLWTYTYDAVGNMTKKSEGGNSDTWVYGYDLLNHLVTATEWTGDPDVPGTPSKLQEVKFTYDWFGNRIEKTVDNNGDGNVDTTERYAQDGWDPHKLDDLGNDNFDVLADLNGANALTTRYVNADALDYAFARIASDGTAGWLLRDYIGSVMGVADNSGILRVTMAYDGWGNETSTPLTMSPVDAGRYGFTGRELDVETGLQYNRERYYDPQLGRWISKDPMGFEAGDSNLYRYVNNQPTNFWDPSGQIGLFFDGCNYVEKDNTLVFNLKKAYEEANPGQIAKYYKTEVGNLDKVILDAYNLVKKARDAKPNEPVVIVGWSRGGMAAYALATKLSFDNITVQFVGVIDPTAPIDVAEGPDYNRLSKGNGSAQIIPDTVENLTSITRSGKIAYTYKELTFSDFLPKLRTVTAVGNESLFMDRFFCQNHPTLHDAKKTKVSELVYTNITHLETGFHEGIGKDMLAAMAAANIPVSKDEKHAGFLSKAWSNQPRGNHTWNDVLQTARKSTDIDVQAEVFHFVTSMSFEAAWQAEWALSFFETKLPPQKVAGK